MSYIVLPQHAKVALMLQESGIEVKQGELISYVKTNNKEKVMPTGWAKPSDINIDKYIELARSIFAPILEPLGMNFDEIVFGDTTLDSFM